MAMEHGADKIGPARDEMMKKQLRGELTADRYLRVEEQRELQPAGEDQPQATWAPDTVLTGGTPHGMTATDVGVRSELAQYLGRSVYPAERSALLRTLRSNHAPDRLIELAESLPAHERFGNVQSIVESLGLGVEDRRN
ncbi:DUF2795 domain-containing protein [Streptomyces sp. NPDC017993]|uniref:DUF2795 domain-containing protein n=1 Tax=Streptomyces sp. NPDC017993 TaxID=3365027 RepID=UPI0037A307BD